MFLSGCSVLPFLPKSPSQRFEHFLKDYFDGKFRVNGDREKLPFAWLRSDADSFRAIGATRALQELHTIDTLQLSGDERIDWLQVEASLKRDINDTALHHSEKNPGLYLTLGGIFWKVEGQRIPSEEEWSEILKTLRDQSEILKLGRTQLLEPPPLWIGLAVNTAKRYEDFLLEPFKQKVLASSPSTLKDSLLIETMIAAQALASFCVFLQETLKAGAENSWAVGQEYYDWLLREYHFLPYTAETMIEAGRNIHNETKESLELLARRIDSTKTYMQLIEEMKSRHPEPGKIMNAYHAESDRARDLVVQQHLIDIPEPETLLFVPTMPALRETYAWGGYGGIERRHDTLVGRFFVTDVVPEMTEEQIQQKLRAQNNGWITVIALHEGYPGHHVQSLYAAKNKRKVRSGFGSTYYGEGWALYAESFMARNGYYVNTDDSLAWLNMRLWRTARVIVDPSIHTGRMTYDQAVQFMIDEVGLERSAAEAEVNRYTTWPTQAPSYIIGWLEMENLKREIQQQLGNRFNEKEFVEAVLSVGSLPLELMKRAVRIHYEKLITWQDY